VTIICFAINISTSATGRTFYATPEPVLNATVVDGHNCIIEWNHNDSILEVLQYEVRFISANPNSKYGK